MASKIDLVAVAKACGYPKVVRVDTLEALDRELELAKHSDELCLIEVRSSLGAREDLGRPTTTAIENKNEFMRYLADLR